MFAACTGCSACIKACPQGIIGLGAGRYPELDFARGECTFCGACAEACEEEVFVRLHEGPAFSHLVAIGEECLTRRGVVCQSCGDTCPETAIRFAPKLRGAPTPSVLADSCTGCGACIEACPVSAVAVAPRAMAGAHA